MRLFSHDQSERYYLSPYAKVTIRNERLTVHNTVFNSAAELYCPETIAFELLEGLSKGATKDWLLMFFLSLFRTAMQSESLIHGSEREL